MNEETKPEFGLPLAEWRNRFPSAFVPVELGDVKIEVVRPVSNEELGGTSNEKKSVGGLTVDNDVVVVVMPGDEVVAIALDSAQRSGDFTVEEFDWKEIVRRVDLAEKGIDGKFHLGSGIATKRESVYLPGATGIVLKPDANGGIEGLLEIVMAANNKVPVSYK